MIKRKLITGIICLIALDGACSSLANPAVILPDARVAVGVSYHLGGYTITNKEVASMLNRIHGRIDFSPFKFVGLGIGAGVAQMDVDHYGSGRDSVPLFHGDFGFSGGAHLKLSTPSFFNTCFTALAQGTYFSSKNSRGALYGGEDAAAMAGIQIHIPHFGYVTAGPMAYLIKGFNKSYTGVEGYYSNVNNVRGWLGIDFFPKVSMPGTTKPYISLEFSASPLADYSRRIPVQEYSISVSIGSVTKKLYGEETGTEWEP